MTSDAPNVPLVEGAREARYAEAIGLSDQTGWIDSQDAAVVVRAVLPLVDAEVAAAVSEAQAEVRAPFRCCVHCPDDDPEYHTENPPHSHDTWCTTCGDPAALLLRAESAEAEVERLREGIRTVADEWEARYQTAVSNRVVGPDRVAAAALFAASAQVRALLSSVAPPEACYHCGRPATPGYETHDGEPVCTKCLAPLKVDPSEPDEVLFG